MPVRGRLCGLVAAIVVLAAPAPALADYVALGDSYTAGPLIPAFSTSRPFKARSPTSIASR